MMTATSNDNALPTAAAATREAGSLDVQALYERYADTFATRDTKRIGALHAEDGTFWLHTDQGPIRGRSAIEEAFAQTFATWPNLRFEENRTLFGPDFWVLDWALFADFNEQTVTFQLTDTVTLDDEGLVVRKDTWVDSAQVTKALGSLTPDGDAT
ncbi:nuclear transport factor 2 family protein [Janibacter anophelis]